MKMHNRRRTQVLGLIGALAALLAGIPEVEAHGARGSQGDDRPQHGAGALLPTRAVAPLPPVPSEARAQRETKRSLLVLLSELTGDRVIRRLVALGSSTGAPATIRESSAQERARPRGPFFEIEERRSVTPIITSPEVQVAYASTGACLFAAGVVASKVLPVSLGRAVTVSPQPWPAGIHISGSFDLP